MSVLPTVERETGSVETLAPALWMHRGPVPVMRRPHRHDDLEINVVVSGSLSYLFGGEYLTIPAGSVAVFWGATPHRLLPGPDDDSAEVCWVHIPLSTVLGWGLPDPQVREMLRPHPSLAPAATLPHDPALLFHAWREELRKESDAPIALLEAQALVRRVLGHSAESPAPAGEAPSPQMTAVAAMTRFIAERFREPLLVEQIAGAAHLSGAYAMTLFRHHVGSTISGYISRCRVAEAQRLLLTTSRPTAEIGYAAGFGSQSAFYEQFTRASGTSPGRYRRAIAARSSR